jgi:hypothetical protein
LGSDSSACSIGGHGLSEFRGEVLDHDPELPATELAVLDDLIDQLVNHLQGIAKPMPIFQVVPLAIDWLALSACLQACPLNTHLERLNRIFRVAKVTASAIRPRDRARRSR